MPEEWMADAACVGKGHLFFPDAAGAVHATKAAKRLCATCPVFTECEAEDERLLQVIGISEVFGTVAGRSCEERRDWQREMMTEGRKHKTSREHRDKHRRILDLTYQGYSGRDIALQLHTTERSVSRCRSGVCGLPGRTDHEQEACA